MINHRTLWLLPLILCACGGNGETPEGPGLSAMLTAPSDVAVTPADDLKADVTWTDNSTHETGFAIYLINPADIDNPSLCGTVAENVTGYSITSGLEYGKNYYVGVQALAAEEKFNSKITKVMFSTPDKDAPKVAVSKAESHPACVTVTYSLTNINGGAVTGVCWSADGTPDVKGARQDAAPGDGASERKVVISNALLDYGKEYSFCAYAMLGGKTYYSDPVTCSLGTESESIKFNWKKLDISGFPSSVTVYETTDKLDSRNFHAWYAVADLSAGDVEFKVRVPSSAATVDDQAKAEGNCLVMVNGGYFYSGRNTGIAYVDGAGSGSVTAVRGSLKTADEEYNVMYNVTRGIFGIGSDTKPAVYWAASDASGNNRFYDRPLPSVKGEDKYGVVSDTNPSAPASWKPKYAQSAGPVLLYDGKCPFDFETTSRGADFYLTNFEMMPYDIYGPSVKPDRTAAGYTADGKVILFICDGRIPASDGATLTELAMIMKGLGCVGAVNFDGGGSTAMVAGGTHLNDQTAENRPVVSTLGFYRK